MKKERNKDLINSLVNGVESGDRLTVNEWATRLSIEPDRVRVLLSYMRKRKGLEFFPVGGNSRDGGGVIVNILEDEEDYKEVSERYHNNCVNPAISSAFRLIENGYLSFSSPEQRQYVEGMVDRLQESILTNKKKLNLVKKIK